MEKSFYLKVQLQARNILLVCGSFFLNFIFSNISHAKLIFNEADEHSMFRPDTSVEKKVDYLERIYFSGENKEGLNTNILITLQELRNRTPTPSLAKQVTFLIEIQDNANDAETACDILDLLAVGIYSIDAAEAQRQGVLVPSDKAKVKAGDALASLNKLHSSSHNLSSSASNLAWSSYLLSGGKYTKFTSGASKVARTSANVGYAAGAVGQAGRTAKDLADVGKSLGINIKKKDKPCDKVVKKDIEIGEHSLPGTSTIQSSTAGTKIIIKNISYNQLSSLSAAIEKLSGISSVNSDDFNNNTATIQISHNMKVKELIDKIIETNKGINFNIETVSANTATLAIK